MDQGLQASDILVELCLGSLMSSFLSTTPLCPPNQFLSGLGAWTWMLQCVRSSSLASAGGWCLA